MDHMFQMQPHQPEQPHQPQQQGVMPVLQMQQELSTVGQRYRGTIKSFSESTGYGFIGGPEVLSSIGKDVFLHSREVIAVTGIEPAPPIPNGAAVTFAVAINPRGQPQARELRFEDPSFIEAQRLARSMGMPIPQPHTQAGGQKTGNFGDPSQYVQNGRRFRGFVRTYSPAQGFGFVGGSDVTANFPLNVFLHFKELQPIMGYVEKPNVPSGTWVTFTVVMNQKGQPQAREVQFEGTPPVVPPPNSSPAYDPSVPPAFAGATAPAFAGATAAVATLNLQSVHAPGGQVSLGAFNPLPDSGPFDGGSNYPSSLDDADAERRQRKAEDDARAYARVQEDIERFTRQAAVRTGSTGGHRSPSSLGSRSRSRSRSPHRRG